MSSLNFIVLHDPGPYPLARGMELCLFELYFGLRYHSFNPGTRLLDESTGRIHSIVRGEKGFVLRPPAARLTSYTRLRRLLGRSRTEIARQPGHSPADDFTEDS